MYADSHYNNVAVQKKRIKAAGFSTLRVLGSTKI